MWVRKGNKLLLEGGVALSGGSPSQDRVGAGGAEHGSGVGTVSYSHSSAGGSMVDEEAAIDVKSGEGDVPRLGTVSGVHCPGIEAVYEGTGRKRWT